MTTPSLCLFDMDGVLFDTEIYFMDILIEETSITLETPITDHKMLYPKMAGKSSPEMIDTVCQELNLPHIIYEKRLSLSKIAEERIQNLILNKDIPLKEGLIEFFQYLEDLNIPKSLCSNSPLHVIQNFLSSYNLEHHFTYALSAEQCGELKPSPLIYIETMKKHQISAENTLIFEDSQVGITAAKTSGAHYCIINQPYNQNISHQKRINNFYPPYSFMEVH